MSKRLWILLIVFAPITIMAIGGAKRLINLPGFTSDRVLFVNSDNDIEETDIAVSGASNDTLSGIQEVTLGTANITVGVGQNLNLLTQNELRFNDSSGGEYIGFRAPGTVTSSTLFELPDGDGNNGQTLVTNGSGVLDWKNQNASGGYSYFPDFEADDETNVSTYNDAAATPVDLTGGTVAGLTVTSETTNPLSGSASYLLSKDAVNRQGQGFTITISDLQRLETVGSQNITINFSYETSANYASDDVLIYTYRVGSNTLEACNGLNLGTGGFTNDLKAAPDGASFTCVVSVTSSDTSVRIGAHIATTNASAFDITVDRINISTATQIPVPIMTDMKDSDASTTWDGDADVTTISKQARWGQYMILEVETTLSGAPPASTYEINLPTGFSIDTDALAGGGGTQTSLLLTGRANDSDGSNYPITSSNYQSATVIRPQAAAVSGADAVSQSINQTNPTTWASGDVIYSKYLIPITKYASSNATMSTTAVGNRAVRVTGAGNGGTALTADVTNIDWTEVSDPFGAWNGTQFTAPSSGEFCFAGGTAFTAAGVVIMSTYIDGTVSKAVAYGDSGLSQNEFSGCETLEKGEALSFRAGANRTLSNTAAQHHIKIWSEPDFSVFGVYGVHEILSARSSVKTPGASGDYLSMTGNSVTVTPGRWGLTCNCAFQATSSPGYAFSGCGFHSANGGDSGTKPSVSFTGFTVEHGGGGDYNGFNTTQEYYSNGQENGVAVNGLDAPVIIGLATASEEIFCVPRVLMSTPANARIWTNITAKRLQ